MVALLPCVLPSTRRGGWWSPAFFGRNSASRRGGEVEIELDGSALRIEPVAGSGLEVEEGLLVIPSVGTPVSIEEMHELIDVERHRA